jgi:3-deoxy-7-phosphoheptulonate synthase
MLIVLNAEVTDQEVQAVVDAVRSHGWDPKPMPGALRTAICVLGNKGPVDPDLFASMPGVVRCIPVTKPYKLVSRETHPEDSVVEVHGVPIGGKSPFAVIAGPCAVESRQQIMDTAAFLASQGVRLMRGGAFKPRTSPYAFQGLGEQALQWLAEAGQQYGVGIVTEATDHENIAVVEQYVDIVQIGARNMQNFSLLRRAGTSLKAVLLKRGMAATIDEWLMAAEYILSGGNRRVILCERGVRTFSDHTRNTLDLSSVPVVKKMSHLPVIVDPSHAAGVREFVPPLSYGARAVGSHGIIVEIHPDPAKALSDGAQSLPFDQFAEMLKRL